MPYISKERREDLDNLIDLLGNQIESEGELNYVFTRLAHRFVKRLGGMKYAVLNSVLGVFEAAKLEFYRRRIAPYEDEKIEQNGDVD